MRNHTNEEIVSSATLQYISNPDYEHLKHYIKSDDKNLLLHDVRDMKFTVKKIGRIAYDRRFAQWVLLPELHVFETLGSNEVLDYKRAFDCVHMSMGWLNWYTEQYLEHIESVTSTDEI